jgi:hypothetical protein
VNGRNHDEETTMNAKVTPTIADEQPHDAYTEAIKCKYVVGPGRKQCGHVRYVKVQDVFQVRFCRVHAKVATAEKRRASAKAKRAAAEKGSK